MLKTAKTLSTAKTRTKKSSSNNKFPRRRLIHTINKPRQISQTRQINANTNTNTNTNANNTNPLLSPTSTLLSKKPPSHQKTNHVSIRHYDIPHYVGFRRAFDEQLHVYANKQKTPISLHHFLNWPINHLPAYSSLDKETIQRLNIHSKPVLDVNNLNDQVYHPEYQTKIIENAQFLWNELPVRLAQRVIELENLPYGLSQTPQLLLVKHWYETSFRDIITSLPPVDSSQERNFTRMLNTILQRHKNVIPTIAQGMLLQKPKIHAITGGLPCPYIKEFLDSFYLSRISIRMLIAQHIALHKPMPGFCGTIHLELDPINVIRAAANEATDLCERTYGTTPDVSIFYSHHDHNEVQNVTFPSLSSFNPQLREEQERIEREKMYIKMQQCDTFTEYRSEPGRMTLVSSHLHHTMFELLKNSCRATVEYYDGPKTPQVRHQKSLPDVNVLISEGVDDITIKISDTGGGIPHQYQKQLFSYLFTTADASVQEMLTKFDVSGGAQLYKQQHDDHITMLSPPQPFTFSSKSALLSLSASSILQTEPTSMKQSLPIPGGGSNQQMFDFTHSSSAPNVVIPHDQQHLLIDPSVPLHDDGEDNLRVVSAPAEGWGPSAGSGMRLIPISGFGYGLALSSQTLKANNGTLQLFSTEGHGTDALIYLPKTFSPDQNLF